MPRRPPPQVEVKLTNHGTLSWPAALRNRWSSSYLMVEDHGGYAVVRPMKTDDPYAITRQRPARDTPEARAARAARLAAVPTSAPGAVAKKAPAKKAAAKKAATKAVKKAVTKPAAKKSTPRG